jgi:ATP-binding cassette subfamily A (ABC1) protein 3
MANGQRKAVGTPFSLKKQYGEGYRLVCVKNYASVKSDDVTKLLRKHIPDLQKESEIGTELSYCMSEKYVDVFQNMLQDLEENAKDLNIDSYGISLTTLEEVFMK